MDGNVGDDVDQYGDVMYPSEVVLFVAALLVIGLEITFVSARLATPVFASCEGEVVVLPSCEGGVVACDEVR